MLCPPPLRPGDSISVIAPSSPFDDTLVLRGLGWLSTRYRVHFSREMFRRTGFLAGSDERRTAELNRALNDPAARAIVAARGGYGLNRIAHQAALRALLDRPKWIVGFSDVTALHVEAQRVSVASLHAHNVAGLGRGDAIARERWIAALERPTAARPFEGLSVWRPGSARGTLVGGNLTVLCACALAGRLSWPPGSVLLLEDVGEAPYRLDRALSTLWVGGLLDSVGAVLLGDFHECDPGRHGTTAEQVLRERLLQLRVPVLAGLPIGHGRRNDPVHLGFTATVDGARARVTLEPP